MLVAASIAAARCYGSMPLHCGPMEALWEAFEFDHRTDDPAWRDWITAVRDCTRTTQFWPRHLLPLAVDTSSKEHASSHNVLAPGYATEVLIFALLRRLPLEVL